MILEKSLVGNPLVQIVWQRLQVATLVHLIEYSKAETRAEGIRFVVLLEVP